MSQIDAEKNQSSEEQEQRSEKLVDVSEAIRYRKRAQSAEQKQTMLEQELNQSRGEIERLNKSLSEMTIERQLIEKLVASGARDLEAAVIIGKARLEADKQLTAGDIVGQMKKEKGYLFSDNNFSAAAGIKTSGVKDRLLGTAGALERTAKKACKTGSRADLQEYLRARRNFV
jgi:TolA-binding protein